MQLYSGKQNSSYRQIIRFTGVLGSVQFVSLFISLLRNKLAAVILGTIGLGLIDLYNRTVSFFVSCVSLVTPMAAIRALAVAAEKNDNEHLQKEIITIRSWSVLSALTGWLICVLLSPITSRIVFDDYAHTVSFIALSPIVPSLVLVATETAVLKAMRHLKSLSMATLWNAVTLFVVTLPSFLLWGMQGIIPALVITSILSLIICLKYTLPLFPWKIQPFNLIVLKQGTALIRLSIFYILADIISTGTEFLVRTYLLRNGIEGDLGLYSAGFIITIAASRFVFVAMDADYFPRLSSVCHHPKSRMLLTVNRQIEAIVLLITPFLIATAGYMPIIIRILYAPSFTAMTTMTIIATIYMFFKSTVTPLSYIPLAYEEGRIFLLLELAYNIFLLPLIILGYSYWGITGTGIALALTQLLHWLLTTWTCRQRWQFCYSRKSIRIIFILGSLLAVTIAVSLTCNNLLRYTLSTFLTLLSAWYSWRILKRDLQSKHNTPSLR